MENEETLKAQKRLMHNIAEKIYALNLNGKYYQNRTENGDIIISTKKLNELIVLITETVYNEMNRNLFNKLPVMIELTVENILKELQNR